MCHMMHKVGVEVVPLGKPKSFLIIEPYITSPLATLKKGFSGYSSMS